MCLKFLRRGRDERCTWHSHRWYPTGADRSSLGEKWIKKAGMDWMDQLVAASETDQGPICLDYKNSGQRLWPNGGRLGSRPWRSTVAWIAGNDSLAGRKLATAAQSFLCHPFRSFGESGRCMVDLQYWNDFCWTVFISIWLSDCCFGFSVFFFLV